MMNILVTGGLGFIGSHFIKYLLSKTPREYKIYNIDNMGYGSNIDNLSEYQNDPRYLFIRRDINDISNIDELRRIEIVINIAAETHVDRSIANPDPFIHSNYNGTFKLLEYVRKNNVNKFIQVSTDEVYGEAQQNSSFKENRSSKSYKSIFSIKSWSRPTSKSLLQYIWSEWSYNSLH